MALNIELAERVLERIAAKPEHHNQATWREARSDLSGCGTTACIAGWAGVLAGGKWVSNDPGHLHFDDFVAEPDDPSKDVFEYLGQRYVAARYRGMRVLGLSEDRANELFETTNNEEAIAMLRRSIRSAKAARTRKAAS